MLLALFAGLPQAALGQDRCDGAVRPGEARLSLHFDDLDLEAALAAKTLASLRGALASGVSACQAKVVNAESVTALLTVSRVSPSSEAQSVRIEIADRATDKHLSRELALGAFPEDSRALLLAVALDELLRASWLELALSESEERRNEAPQVVREVVDRDVQGAQRRAPAAAPGAALPLHFFTQLTGQAFTRGEWWLGPDVGLSIPLHPALALDAAFGARRGPFHRTELGRVRLTGASASLALRYGLHETPGYTLSADLTLAAMVAQVGGIARAGESDAEGASANNTMAAWSGASLGATASVALSESLRVRLSGGLGLSLFPVVVVDDAATSVDTRGLVVHLNLGLELRP